MKNIFSRKHDTQTGNSKSFKFWIQGSSQERNASRPVPIQTDDSRIHADIRTSSRAASATNIQPSTAEDKPTVSASPAGVYPTTRTYTVPQATFHSSRPSRHRDYNEPLRTGYPPTSASEREDRTKARRIPSKSVLAPTNRTELWSQQHSLKQPEPPDDRHREQPFHEDTERRGYRNEPDTRYGTRKESPKAKESKEVDEDRFRVSRDQHREESGTLPERHVTSLRTRDKDRARETEPEGMREKEKVRQRERERHQREFEKERERQKAERQQREQERGQERERIKLKEQEREKERERQKELEKRELEKQKAHEKEERERERQRETEREKERERQREERERQKQKEERERLRQREERDRERLRERERQRELERERQREFEREKQRELERERLREERERERNKELERERIKEEKDREWQKELEREREFEREKHRELERERVKEERAKERARHKELDRERQKEEREKERERQKELERERQRELEDDRERERERRKVESERQREFEIERERERERQKELELERQQGERERERRQKELELERLKEEREREQQRQIELEMERLKEERERERQRQIELEMERLKEERERERQRQKEVELERLKERERERQRQKELEMERLKEERERQRRKELEMERLKEERERERQRQKEVEMERLKEERERERQRQKDLEMERLKEERERERQRLKELEMERLKEERERERQRLKELEMERLKEERERGRQRQKELEMERLKEERERERQRLKELEMERLKEERERERQRQKDLEMERLKEERERERQRLKELEMERLKEERERERQRLKDLEMEREEREQERQRQKELELERLKELRERERQKELERERHQELEKERELERLEEERERERQRELERDRQRERERERQRQKELERERHKEEREQERQRQEELQQRQRESEKERERERQRQKELERERLKEERQRQKELEQERQRELDKEEERGRERERQREEKEREHGERERLKELDRKKVEQERERAERDRDRRGTARNRTRGRGRRLKEDHDRDQLRREGEQGQELVMVTKQSTTDLKLHNLNIRVDPSQRCSKVEGIVEAGLEFHEAVKPIVNEEYHDRRVVKEPHQDQECHQHAAKVHVEAMDGGIRPKTGWGRERRKEGKPGRVSDDDPSPDPRTSRQLERPVADGWGDSSDESEDQGPIPQGSPKHDRTDDEKVVQSRRSNPTGSLIISASGNQKQLRSNQTPINPVPHHATPQAAPISIAFINAPTGQYPLPLASNSVSMTPHDNEYQRTETNRSKPNREYAEPLKPIESSRPASHIHIVQPIQVIPHQAQKPLKDGQLWSTVLPPVFEITDGPKEIHAKVHSEGLKEQIVPIELPANVAFNSRATAVQEPGRAQPPPWDGKDLKSFPNPSIELNVDAKLPSWRQLDSAWRQNDAQQERRTEAAIPAQINWTLPTEVHPAHTQLEEKVRRIVSPEIQNSRLPSVDVERHQDFPVRSETPLTAAVISMRTLGSSIAPNPTSVPTPNPVTASNVYPRTHLLPPLPPESLLHPVNHQPNGNIVNNSNTALTPAAQNSTLSVGTPPPSTNNHTSLLTCSSRKANFVRPPSPINTLPPILSYPHNGGSVAAVLPLPPDSSAPLVNPLSHMRLPQSNATMPVSAQTPFLAALPVAPDFDGSVTTGQFAVTGTRADSLTLSRDEDMVDKRQSIAPSESYVVTRQRPPSRSEVTKVHPSHFPHGVPDGHSVPSIPEAREVHRTARYRDVNTSRFGDTAVTDLSKPSLVGATLQDTITRPGTVSVLEKTTDKPTTNQEDGKAGVFLSSGMAPTPSYVESCWEKPFSNSVMPQNRGPTELGPVVSPYIGQDASRQQTPLVPPRDLGRTPALGDNQTNDSTGRHIMIPDHQPSESQPSDQIITTSLQAKENIVRPPTQNSWKRGNSDSRPISEALASRQGQNHVVTSTIQPSMDSSLKTHGGAPNMSPFGLLSSGSEDLPLAADLIGMPTKPINGSPKCSLPPQTTEVHISSARLDSYTGAQPKEDGLTEKVDAVFPLISSGASNSLSGLKKDSRLARHSVINTSVTTLPFLPSNLDGARKPSNHKPNVQADADHAVPPSETIRVHREPQSANVTRIPPISHTPGLARPQAETVPQIKIRHSITAEGLKRDTEVPLSSKTPIFSGSPETTAVAAASATIPQNATIPAAAQTLTVRPKVSFIVGASIDKPQPRNQHNESPGIKVLKVDDAPSSFTASAKKRSSDFGGQAKMRSSNAESPKLKRAEDPILTRVLLKESNEPRKLSSKESPKKVAASLGAEGVLNQDVRAAVQVVSSRQGNMEQLHSSKLPTKQLPVIPYQSEHNTLDLPQPKIQHPVLAELLSSPQTTPVTQLASIASDKGHSKGGTTILLDSPNPGAQPRPHGTPPDLPRHELEQKIQTTKETPSTSRSIHRKIQSTTFQMVELPPLQEHHQGRISNPSRPTRGMVQESGLKRVTQIPDSQRDTALASRSAQQPLQHGQGRHHQHSASLPTSSTLDEKPVQELPRSITPSPGYAKQTLAHGRSSQKRGAQAVPPSASEEAASMTPAPFAALRQTDPRQSNADSVKPQTGKKIRRFKLPSAQAPSAQAPPAQPYQVWHPGTSSKTPNSSPSQSSGVETPLEHDTTQLNKEPNKMRPALFPVPKGKSDARPDVTKPVNFSHRMKRTVSRASIEARNGTAPSTVVGSPNASMLSATPLPPPPSRDTWKATHDWVNKGEDRVQAQPKRRRPRPGVVFDTDEDAPEDKQRPRRTLTKYRSTAAPAKRHESSKS